ncbi:MAG: cell division topological specificity factor MinE [Succinivibrio sp.]|nr:cell division topological specificity factor MinE [Succinivibrio sp.]
MSIFSSISEAIFKDKKQSSAVSAKERLHLVLISDRAGRDVPDYMPKMRQEIFEVLKKYIKIDSLDEVEFNFDNKNNTSIMEMSVSLEKKPQPLASEDN